MEPNCCCPFPCIQCTNKDHLSVVSKVTVRKIKQQGEPCCSIGCGEIGGSSFALCIMNRVSNIPLKTMWKGWGLTGL